MTRLKGGEKFRIIRAAALALTDFFKSIYWSLEVGFVSKLVASTINDEVFFLDANLDEQSLNLRLEILSKLSEHEAFIALNYPNFADTSLKNFKLTR